MLVNVRAGGLSFVGTLEGLLKAGDTWTVSEHGVA